MDDRQGVRRVSSDRLGTGPVLGSGAVDAQFWALVCEDEEWLQAEFDAIVSAPAEAGRRPVRRPAIGAADHPGRQQQVRAVEGDNPTVVPPGQPGQSRRRERSPPPEVAPRELNVLQSRIRARALRSERVMPIENRGSLD